MTRRFHGRRTICVVSRRVTARLGHDVVGDRVGAADQLLARHDLVDQAVLQRLGGVDRLAGEQRVGGALDAEQFLKALCIPSAGTEPMS